MSPPGIPIHARIYRMRVRLARARPRARWFIVYAGNGIKLLACLGEKPSLPTTELFLPNQADKSLFSVILS